MFCLQRDILYLSQKIGLTQFYTQRLFVLIVLCYPLILFNVCTIIQHKQLLSIPKICALHRDLIIINLKYLINGIEFTITGKRVPYFKFRRANYFLLCRLHCKYPKCHEHKYVLLNNMIKHEIKANY